MSVTLAYKKLHCLRVPTNRLAAIVTHVAKQGGTGGAEAEDGIFHRRLAGSNGVDPVLHMVVVVTVAVGGNVFFSTQRGSCLLPALRRSRCGIAARSEGLELWLSSGVANRRLAKADGRLQ